MKLKIIERRPQRNQMGSFISEIKCLTSSNNNLFRFTKPAFEYLKLKKGTRFFIIKEENTNNYYLKFSEEGDYEVRSRTHKEYTFNSVNLRREFLKQFKTLKNERLYFLILEPIKYENETLYPLEKTDIETLVKHIND